MLYHSILINLTTILFNLYFRAHVGAILVLYRPLVAIFQNMRIVITL